MVQHLDEVATRASRRPRRERTTPPLLRAAPRIAVLAVLGLSTIAVPAVHTLTPVTDVAEPVRVVAQGPSAAEVFAGAGAVEVPTSVLAAVPVTVRAVSEVSRTLERESLPGCSGDSTAIVNGQASSSQLCTLWDGTNQLRPDAAVALTDLNENYRAAFDRDICVTSGYRSYARQAELHANNSYMVAAPGTSNHGYGLAFDMCDSMTKNSEIMSWFRDNGPVYGWVNPRWAQSGGSGPYEPWHWEYLPGTSELGTAW